MGSRLLFDTNVSSKHPLKQADSGGPAPIGPGAARIEAGGT